ncbi:hypothetical protein [Agarilytica rhodophyticola]|uniref:hypothetical protein n=1 Tax=Agarilytica rhodophyticola TaxID=1737490 RepID=UPI000B346D27|nr:hypothetical protein [Agarilytica rhodophyticola]
MAKSDNVQIGTWKCSCCGEDAKVFQTKKRGAHFYTYCDASGWNQGTRAARQNKIWREASFKPGLTVTRPSNVTESEPNVVTEVSEDEPIVTTELTEVEVIAETELTENLGEVETDFNPNEAAEPSSELEESGSRLPNIVAGIALIGSAIGGWLWTNH